MAITNEKFFWKKKEIVSFILSVFVFLIHDPSFRQYSNTDGLVSVINEKASFLLTGSFTYFAVAMFFILSGITFFKGYDNSKYLNKIKSRVFTLIIPYLLWNIIWMIFNIVCSYSFISKYFVSSQPVSLTFTNILKGIFFYEHNIPFWYMFNLIIFSLAAPLIHLIIRNKYIGIASIILLTVFAQFGIGIPSTIFVSQTTIIFYLIGAIIGKHYFDFASRKSNKCIQWLSIIFLLIFIVFKNLFTFPDFLLTAVFEVVLLTLSAYAFWNIIDIFVHKIKPRKIYSRSFAIYAMHVTISTIIANLISICLPNSEWAILNFFATFILTLLIINLICSFLEKFLPKLYAILLGNRVKSSIKKEK